MFLMCVIDRVSFLWKGVQLEFSKGSEQYAKMLAILLILSHSIIVGASYVLANFTGSQVWYPYKFLYF